MTNEFNKNLMLENISYLLKELGKKIGELETEAGVSPGYISRISKDEKTKPGIEFVMKVADSLNTSVDTLLSVNLSEMTPTERYLKAFFEKMIRQTNDDKLSWNKESADSLNRAESDRYGRTDHPLLTFETFYEKTDLEYPQEVSRVVFVSNSFACNTYINGDCFNLSLTNGTFLYLMNLSANDRDAFAKEIWMYTPGTGSSFICSDRGTSPLATLVDNLYKAVSERMKHPQIKQELQDVIDAFMKDDLGDDVTPLPFDI